MEKLVSTKLVPGAKKVGDCWLRPSVVVAHCSQGKKVGSRADNSFYESRSYAPTTRSPLLDTAEEVWLGEGSW